MRYFKVFCGNGYCGCDEEWLATYEDAYIDGIEEEASNNYSYDCADDRYCDISTDEEAQAYGYESVEEYYWCEQVMPNFYWEEISKKEFDDLMADGWRER